MWKGVWKGVQKGKELGNVVYYIYRKKIRMRKNIFANCFKF